MRLLHAFASNAIGQVATIAIALATVPLFTTYFGAERYGCFILLLAFQPYFGIHQLAAARLVTVASARGELGDKDAPLMLRSMVVTGTLVSVILTGLFLALYPLFSEQFSGDPTVAQEVAAARWPAAALLLLTTTTLLHNHRLDGQRRFVASNVLSTVGNLLALVLPLAPILYDGSFDQMVLAVALARLVQAVAGWCLLPKLDGIAQVSALAREGVRHAGQFGWLTISSIGSTAIATMDRIILGLTSSATTLYFYAVPLGVAGRFVVLSAALGRAMSPDFSTADSATSRDLVRRGTEAILVMILAIALPLSFFGHDLMRLWVDPAFADQATPVFRLALAALVGMSLSQAPSILLHSTARAHKQVWLQFAEIVPFIAAVWIASAYGLVAVAWVVVVRNLVDGLAHLWLVGLGWRMALRVLIVIAIILGLATAGPWFDGLDLWSRLAIFVGLGFVILGTMLVFFPATLRFAWEQLQASSLWGERE